MVRELRDLVLCRDESGVVGVSLSWLLLGVQLSFLLQLSFLINR